MEIRRKEWNKNQKILKGIIRDRGKFSQAIDLFLHQHMQLHSASMLGLDIWSFEDEVLEGLNAEQIGRMLPKQAHSIAWIIWHVARIEDVAMNILVAGSEQIFNRDDWIKRLQIKITDTGNATERSEVAELSAEVDLSALKAYRLAVGLRTREVVKKLQIEDMTQKVSPTRLQRVLDEGAVRKEAADLINYWGRRDIAGLCLMPATRHPFVHLNEASRLKSRLG
jgi:hypothetical protein